MKEGKNQIVKSQAEVQRAMRETNMPIHQIRTKNQILQKNSRIFDERRAHERLTAIQQESITSNKKNTALEIKWSELKEYEESQSLSKAIQEQKQAFKLIISAKERLIDQFWQEAKKKDDQYSKTIKEQSKDIKQLVGKMRDQYFVLRDQSLKQLNQIQRKFDEQRKLYIEKAKKEVDQCFQKHTDMESTFAKNRERAEDDFQKKIQQLRIKGMQEFTNMKIKMETDIQNLQKCHEQMKALYQLNTQKLDYNLKVLKQKKEENHNLHEELKKKERILNIKYRNLKDEYEKADQAFKDENKSLTTEYKRITRRFKQLQKKFKHFEKADLERYNQIQEMNEIEVRKLKDKIINCDVTIHNQQLGMEWVGVPEQNQEEKEKEKEKQRNLGLEQEEEEQIQLIISEEKLTELLDILIQQADFIFDEKMREQLQHASKEEKLKQQLQILKKTLNIDTMDELNLFIDEIANNCRYISQKEKHTIIEERLKRQAKEEEERAMKKKKYKGEEKKIQKIEPPPEQENLRVDLKSDFKVDPVMVVDFLVHWMNTREDRKRILEKTTKKSLKQLSERERKEHIAREGKKYWQNLTQVLPERTFRIWKILDKSFSKYYDLLLARQKLIDQTGELHNQNQQLKNLLQQYLQINHQLIIPPTRLMEKDN